MRALTDKRMRDYLAGTLMTAIGLAATLQGATYRMGSPSHMGPGFFPVALGALLTLTGIVITVTARLTHYEGELKALPPEWRGWFCIGASIVAFVVLGRYGGLAPAAFAIVFVSALGDRTTSIVEAAMLALVCVGISVVVFWWGLHLQLPLFRWG
jgi:hypothetical protein